MCSVQFTAVPPRGASGAIHGPLCYRALTRENAIRLTRPRPRSPLRSYPKSRFGSPLINVEIVHCRCTSGPEV